MRGLNKKDATTDQSSVRDPSPSPLMPEPICWAVTDLENIQQTHDMLVSVVKRYPGTRYHEKLQISAIRKNFARDMRCFSCFSCSCNALQICKTEFYINGCFYFWWIINRKKFITRWGGTRFLCGYVCNGERGEGKWPEHILKFSTLWSLYLLFSPSIQR